jgi:hypothetical protein
MAKTNAQVALEAAAEIAKAGAQSGSGGIGWLSTNDVLRTADAFYNWLERK